MTTEIVKKEEASITETQVESALVVQKEQAKALTKIADSLGALSTFLSQGGLTSLLQGYSKANAVQAIFQGLAAHDGRASLDARVLEQNALEIAYAIEAAHDKFAEILKKKKQGPIDPELHDGEADFKNWEKKNVD